MSTPKSSSLLWGHSAGGDGPGVPAEDLRRGGLGMLCAKPLHREGMYDILFFKRNHTQIMPFLFKSGLFVEPEGN